MELTKEQLDAALPHIKEAPKDNAVIDTLCIRPDLGERRIVDEIEVTPEQGVIGDRWSKVTWMHLEDGSPDPRLQVCMIPKRVLDLVWLDRHSQPHPGDNIITDFDMSEANLPVGSILKIGEAELEVTDVYNGGCDKWVARYGHTSFKWLNQKELQPIRLRGVLCKVHKAGRINKNNRIQKA